MKQMNRTLARMYLAASVITVLAITGYFFYGLATSRTDRERASSAEFQRLSTEIAEFWSDLPLEEAATSLSRQLISDDPAAPLVLSVYSFDRGVDYLWARDDRFFANRRASESSMAPIITSNDLVHRRYTRSIELPNGERRIITAVYSILDADNVFPVLRMTVIIFLVAVGAGLLIALVHVVTGKDRTDDSEAYHASPLGDGERADLDAVRTETPLQPGTQFVLRLKREIERASFHEQDISLALLEFSEGKEGSELGYRIAQAVVDFFTFDDLCFDLGHRTIAVVLPSTSLSEALSQIERFQRFFWESRGEWSAPEVDFACGVSARNGRLVEADRLLGETRAAVRRARASSGRIMGFRPDPQRYREFVSTAHHRGD